MPTDLEIAQAAQPKRIQEIAEKAPLAISASKMLLNRAEELSLSEVLEEEKRQQGPLLLSHDCKEGIAAFREKRKAEFTGA